MARERGLVQNVAPILGELQRLGFRISAALAQAIQREEEWGRKGLGSRARAYARPRWTYARRRWAYARRPYSSPGQRTSMLWPVGTFTSVTSGSKETNGVARRRRKRLRNPLTA